MPNKGKYRWQCLMSCGDAVVISEAMMVSGRFFASRQEACCRAAQRCADWAHKTAITESSPGVCSARVFGQLQTGS